MKKNLWNDLRLISAAISGATVLPLLALRESPDPLGGTVLAIGGANSAVIPLVLGHAFAWPAVLKLRGVQSPKPWGPFAAGFALCLIPAMFYACTAPLWTATAPMLSLAIAGAVCGTAVGTCAALYFR
jgi:hypothetical protein